MRRAGKRSEKHAGADRGAILHGASANARCCSILTARCLILRQRRARCGCRRAWRKPSSRLHEKTSGALALVSGRSLNDIDLIFAPEQFPAVGGHGAEMRVTTESEAVAVHAPPMDKELKRRLAAIAKLSPGILLEDKGYSLALHYRLAPHAEKAIYEAVSLDQGRSAECADRSAARKMRLRNQAFRLQQGDRGSLN